MRNEFISQYNNFTKSAFDLKNNLIPLHEVRTLSTIIARFLLSMFCLFMLHELAPHSHHQHELKGVSDHHHDDSGHDHHSEEKSPLDFLSILFANHAHSQQLADHSPSQFQSSENRLAKSKEQKKNTELTSFSVEGVSPPVKINVPELLGIIKNIHFFTTSLRGPPTIG